MTTLLVRRREIQAQARAVRHKRLVGLYEAGISVIEIARMEKVSRARIYQLLNEALVAGGGGVSQ